MTEEMRQALLDGVQAEQNAHDFYKAAAEKVTNPSLKELFSDLAQDELGHRDFLQKMVEGETFSAVITPKREDFHISEELIEEKPELTVDMPFTKALELAIKREQEAMDSYEHMAAQVVDDAAMHDMFINLRNMEQTHKTNLESIYMNVAYTEAW